MGIRQFPNYNLYSFSNHTTSNASDRCFTNILLDFSCSIVIIFIRSTICRYPYTVTVQRQNVIWSTSKSVSSTCQQLHLFLELSSYCKILGKNAFDLRNLQILCVQYLESHLPFQFGSLHNPTIHAQSRFYSTLIYNLHCPQYGLWVIKIETINFSHLQNKITEELSVCICLIQQSFA